MSLIRIALTFSAAVLSGAFNLGPVGPNSKAGLAWPNGPWADVQQYTTTGKVSWYGDFSQTLPRLRTSTGITLGARIPLILPLNMYPCYGVNDRSDSGSAPSTKQLTLRKSLMFLPSTSESINHVICVLPLYHQSGRPEQSGQSNLTVEQGVELWMTYVQPLKAQGILLGSPVPSSAPSGKTWLQDFLGLCGGNCTVDFIAMHWYGINSTQFVEYLQDFHNTFQRDIWVTEWACQVGKLSTHLLVRCLNQYTAELRQCVRSMLTTGCGQLHEYHSIVHG